MKASELRIGNYVLDDEGLMAKINGFQPFGHSVRCDEEEGCLILIDLYRKDGSIGLGYGLESFECKPIPITEEWLLRFGFEKDERGRFVKDEFFCYLVCGASSGWKTWVNLIKDDFTLALVGQVHQLQNLYFALTGQELTIKEAAR